MKFFLLLVLTVVYVQAKHFSLKDIYNNTEDVNDLDTDTIDFEELPIGSALPTEALYIPMSLKACSNGVCQAVCRAIGFKHGVCVTTTTCHCYN